MKTTVLCALFMSILYYLPGLVLIGKTSFGESPKQEQILYPDRQLPFCPASQTMEPLLSVPNAERYETGELRVRIYLHLIRDARGLGGLSMAQLSESLEILQEDFRPFGISFQLEGAIDFIDDQELFEDPNGTGQIIGYREHHDGIDLYLFPDHLGQDVPGGGMVLHIPATAFFLAGHSFEDPKLPLRRSSAISHEMGHCLGLFHTHHGMEQGACEELVNRSNCQTCGDYVCDTPSDPNLFLEVEPEHCTWSGHATDSRGESMQPDLHNIMSYTHPRCMLRFTQGQGQRMRYHLLHHPLLKKCLVNKKPTTPK